MVSKKQRAWIKNLRKARQALKKSAKKYMRKKGKTKGKTIATPVRKRTATIIEKKRGKRKKVIKRYRFPMPDKPHARNALARLSQAKGLSREEKIKIIKRACRILARGQEKGYFAKCCKKHGVKV